MTHRTLHPRHLGMNTECHCVPKGCTRLKQSRALRDKNLTSLKQLLIWSNIPCWNPNWRGQEHRQCRWPFYHKFYYALWMMCGKIFLSSWKNDTDDKATVAWIGWPLSILYEKGECDQDEFHFSSSFLKVPLGSFMLLHYICFYYSLF